MITNIVKKMPEYLIFKSNSLVEEKFNLTAQEQKIFSILACLIQKNDTKFSEQEFHITELAELLQVSNQYAYKELPKITRGLIAKTVDYYEISENNARLYQMGFLQFAMYDTKTGTIKMKFSPILEPYLLGLENKFTSYKLNTVLELDSKYAIRFYERCKMYQNQVKFVWSIEEMREQLCLTQKSYNRYSDLKRKVINTALKEINAKTDLCVAVNEIKSGRSVVALEFIVHPQVKPIAPAEATPKKETKKETKKAPAKRVAETKEEQKIQAPAPQKKEEPKKVAEAKKDINTLLEEVRAEYPADFIEPLIARGTEEYELGVIYDLVSWLSSVSVNAFPSWKAKQNAPKYSPQAPQKKLNFTDYSQREYDYDALERQLLGWDD